MPGFCLRTIRTWIRSPTDRPRSNRKFGEYAVFWPANGRPIYRSTHAGPQWRWLNGNHRWHPAALHSAHGRLTYKVRSTKPQAPESVGFAFNCTDDEANAFPRKCPHCGDDWSRRRIDSPIRDLGSGFQRVMQLLSDGMMREIPDVKRRKLVLFSDSRQDAAKLSTGIKHSHYLDNVRQTVFGRLVLQIEDSESKYARSMESYRQSCELLQLVRKQHAQSLDTAAQGRLNELIQTLEASAVGRLMQRAGSGGTLQPPSPPTGFGCMPFNALLDFVRESLLRIGMNPGGPLPSVREYRSQTTTILWTAIFDWNVAPHRYRSGLQPVEQELRDRIEAELLRCVHRRRALRGGKPRLRVTAARAPLDQ